MLTKAEFRPAIPAQDLQRARAFYSKLGLEPAQERPEGLIYEGLGGTSFLLFESSGQASGTHAQMACDVQDFDATLSDLRSRGIKLEEYDFPGFKTEDGVMTVNGTRAAWIKDSEGNLIAIGELVTAGAAR